VSDAPNPLNVAFASLRSAIPSTTKAVNIYHRRVGTAVETLFAFHDSHIAAEAALDSAQHASRFIRGVTFARGLLAPPTAWIVADAFEDDE
jgi:hypothetical protein